MCMCTVSDVSTQYWTRPMYCQLCTTCSSVLHTNLILYAINAVQSLPEESQPKMPVFSPLFMVNMWSFRQIYITHTDKNIII